MSIRYEYISFYEKHVFRLGMSTFDHDSCFQEYRMALKGNLRFYKNKNGKTQTPVNAEF